MRLLVLIVGLALSAMLLAPAYAGQEATRVVDRTFSCEAGFVGGQHQVYLYSSYSALSDPPNLRLSSGASQNRFGGIVHVTSHGLWVYRDLCVPSRRTLKLTTKGLRGGAVPPLGREATCQTPRRLLLRVRAVFERPVPLRLTSLHGTPQLSATGALDDAAFAIGTSAGAVIAYLSVTRDQKARFFTRRTCKED